MGDDLCWWSLAVLGRLTPALTRPGWTPQPNSTSTASQIEDNTPGVGANMVPTVPGPVWAPTLGPIL